MLIYSAAVSVTGLAFIPIMGYMGTVYGIVVASIIHGMGEGVFGPYVQLYDNLPHQITC